MPQYSGVFTLPQQAQALTSGQWVTDPYFKNTTLLLHADGIPGGAQNNTFLDSSSNAFTITRNGNTTQGAFSPYMPNGYWSNYFDGSGDYIDVPAFTLSGDFTVECWVYKTAVDSSGYTILFGNNAGGNENQFSIDQTTAGSISFYSEAQVIAPSGTAITTNAWHHLAWVREGTTCRAYVDGVQQGTGTASTTVQFKRIGAYVDGGYEINGYLSNVRVLNGTCLYPSGTAFTPSTAPLTAITNTSLLTCQSNRFLDNSTNAFTVTPAGNVAVQQFQPFMRPYQYSTSVIGGSGYFDGNGDILTSSGGGVSGAGAFTVEFWMYPNSQSGTQVIYGSSNAGALYVHAYNNGTFAVGSYDLSTQFDNIPYSLNTWTHIVVVRNSSGTYSVFKNGVRVSTLSGNSTNYSAMTNIRIGGETSNARYFNGYLTDVRVSTTTNLYDPSASTITVPTAPLTAITNTSLLCNFTNAGIYDNAMQNNLETVGNAQVSTSVVKYGSGSMYFDGSGDYLITPSSTSFDLGSGSFTIECWVYPTASGSKAIVGTSTGDASSTIQWRLYVNSSSQLECDIYSTSNAQLGYITYQNTLSLNQWSHVALVRNGNLFSMYVNGVSASTTFTSTGTVANTSTSLKVGYFPGSSISALTGYIDDLRITKGIARYTSNFQPPQVAFANQ